MYRLLIADDEPLVKERLTKTIPWKDFGISQVLTAADGKEALDLALEHSIDVIITDIRMPIMNGIELFCLFYTSGTRKQCYSQIRYVYPE